MVTSNSALAPTSGPATIFQSSNMGEGSSAITWLAGDVNGDGRDEIIQLWNNGGQLGMIVYGWSTNDTLIVLWSSSNMGEGSGALSFQIGDVNGDKQAEIVQLWNNGGQLAMIVYGWSKDKAAMTVVFETGNIGQGSPAVGWLIGDVDGDNRDEVVQLWNNNGRLGIIVYGWTGTGMSTAHSNGDMGYGWAPEATLQLGDINGDGKAEILQLWPGYSYLVILVYGLTTNGLTCLGKLTTTQSDATTIGWLVGDVNGDKQAEMVQLCDNNGTLSMNIFNWSNNAVSLLWSSNNMGQGSPALSWLIGDMNGDGSAEISQQWNHGGTLGVIIYAWKNQMMATQWSGDMGQGSPAEAWLMGDVKGNGRADIIQEWNNSGNLGTIIYGY